MYAVVKIGGKQYRVEKGDTLVVDRLQAKEGDKLSLQPLLFTDGKKAVFEGADLGKVKVDAVVRGHERGPKLHVLKFKPKKGYKRRTGHRSELTRIEIGDIKIASPARKGASAPGQAKSGPASPRRRPAGASASKRTTSKRKKEGDGS
jgi:large subunit ribosomal protein L21